MKSTYFMLHHVNRPESNMFLLCQYIVLLRLTYCMGAEDTRYLNYEKGIFGQFLARYLDLLSYNCSGPLVKQYFEVVADELRKMPYNQTLRLSKIYKRLSKTYSEDINAIAREYRKQLDTKLYFRVQFLKAMDEILTLKEFVLLDEYIYDLSDYCEELVLVDMRAKTRRVIHEAIINQINRRLMKREREDLADMLKDAVREWKRMESRQYIESHNITATINTLVSGLSTLLRQISLDSDSPPPRPVMKLPTTPKVSLDVVIRLFP